ncbi:MAG: hypothetical protein GQ582_08460 [Methyloprofundus sp.]|nr:hypothetical protein [Methyloprofundus sp.]
MSFRSSLTKIIIKLTPNQLIIWGANFILKDIAKLTGFNFDIDTRKLYAQVHLAGETEMIDVWLEEFTVLKQEGRYAFFMQDAKSNRVWLDNILSRITGKEWRIPVPAQLASYADFVAELLEAQKLEKDEESA